MLLKLLDQKIRRAFSNSALQYEALAGLQNEIGRELVRKVFDQEPCDAVLDVGMGTGRLTNRLSFLFPDAKVVGIDFAPGMVEIARKKYESFSVVQANAAALPFRDAAFDVIVSNLAYQWVTPLESAFGAAYAALKEGGTFCLTMFTEETLQELFAALEAAQGAPVTVRRLPSEKSVLGAIGRAGFKVLEQDRETITVHFEDLWTLVRWLKETGANTLEKDLFIGKEWLTQANDYYLRNYRDDWGVYATFKVLWIKSRKEEDRT